MRRFLSLAILVVISVVVASGQTTNPVSISSDGWTLTADAERGVLDIAYEKLGTVVKNVRLNLQAEGQRRPLTRWSLETPEANRLSIKTTQPRTAWLFTLGPGTLEISSTSAEAVITAQAPAPADRILARLMDLEGVPVTWVGTQEVVGTYGGSDTRNPSHLPRRNPEVMYFSLGQVSSSNLHALFDRKVDTAIQFPEKTVMRRSNTDADLLDVTMPVAGNALLRVIPNYFTETLGVPYYVPFDDSYFSRPPMVWSSWTSYYDEVTEQDMVRNADWIAAHLKSYGFQYVQLDDGYDRGKNGEHYWIEKWDQEKFPHGPKWLADYIKSKGLHAGIWIVPNAYAGAVEQHPEWYLRFQNGKIVLDYHTPSLDSTNPEVLDFLKKEFTTLDDWGFEYYKFDGEHAIPKYAPGVDLSRLYDKNLDPLVAYRNRLQLIRETIGPRRFIEGCPAGTPLNGIGFFNSYFNGDDLYGSWQGMYALFSSINANAFLNHLLVYVMPGEGMELNPPMSVAEAEKKRDRRVVETARTREEPLQGLGTTLAEARTVVSFVSLTGVAYPMASVMPELPEEREQLLKKTLPTVPILPIDLFSRGTDMSWDKFKHTTADDYIHNYPEILDLKVNAPSGIYDVAALTNWRSWTASRELDFTEQLGLDPSASYLAFDFWNQKILGAFKNRLALEVEPHDTRVLLLHQASGRPQLVGTSRHITGVVSILSLAWDDAKNTLRGSSQTVPGDPYTLWVYVPGEEEVLQVRASTEGNREVPAQHQLAGNSLSVSFAGQPETVNWEIAFKR